MAVDLRIRNTILLDRTFTNFLIGAKSDFSLLINIISNKSGYIYIIHIIIHIYYNHDEYIKNQEFNHFQYMHVHMNSHLLYTIITIITIIMIVIIIYYCYSLLLFFK